MKYCKATDLWKICNSYWGKNRKRHLLWITNATLRADHSCKVRMCNISKSTGPQYHWVYGLCPSSGILNNYKTQCFGNCISFRLQVSGREGLLCWIHMKELTSITGPNRVGVLFPSPVDGNRFRSDWVLCTIVRTLYGLPTKKKLHGLSPRTNYTDRPSDCSLLAKWLPTFADIGWNVVSHPYGRILGFPDRTSYFSIK
jgi:hypothetical protein